MFDPDKIYVLEWSRSQQCFHIHTLLDCIKQNCESLAAAHHSRQMPDYIPIDCNETGRFFESDEQEERLFKALCGLTIPCSYCGATEEQTGRRHQIEHFLPRCGGGTDLNQTLRLACPTCNGAKQGRIFKTVQHCRAWLHWKFWTSSRRRYAAHRLVAFGGEPPSSETVALGLKLNDETCAQPNNSKLLKTSKRYRDQNQTQTHSGNRL